MTDLSPSALAPTFVFLVIIAAILGRRTLRIVRGTPVVPGQLFGLAALYAVLFVLLAGVESLPLLPLWSIGVDVAAAFVGGYVALEYVTRRAEVYRVDGVWMYRLGYLVPVSYIVLFAVRVVLEVAVVGINPFAGSSTLPVLSPFAQTVLEAVDALFGFSTGMAVGRNLGVYRKYRAALATAPLATA